jgi:hypothetical protein
MASRELRIDTAGVGAASATTAAAASQARSVAPVVTPCAEDATSMHIATRAAARIGALGLSTVATNLATEAAAARLHGDADAYTRQEALAATTLSSTAHTSQAIVDAPNTPEPPAPTPPPPTGVPAGVVPTTGHEIAAVIHSGPGPQGVLAVAALLDSAAEDLDSAATTVSAAGVQTAQSWTSDAADAAGEHLARLENSYTGQSSLARGLAQQLRGHADDFARAKAQIPPPQHFADLEARLRAAYAANAHPTSMGCYPKTITDLQLALAAANNDAVNGYSRYQQAAQTRAATMAAHPDPDTGGADPKPNDTGASGTGDNDHAGHDPEKRDATDPLTAAAPAGVDGFGDVAGQLMGTVLPTVLGAVSGAAGGALGALGGAGQQLQQAGGQLVNGIAQGAQATANPPAAGGDPSGTGSGGPSLPTPDGSDGGGGPEPGDMEPASGAGAPALSAPAGAAAAASAAPATFSAAPVASTAAPGGGSGGVGMMPPMMPMGGRPGGTGGEDDRRLYPERRMRVESPPNSEPVKGRREVRRARGEKASETRQ